MFSVCPGLVLLCHFLFYFEVPVLLLSSCQVSRLCDCFRRPNVFHLCLIVFPPPCVFKLCFPSLLCQIVLSFEFQHIISLSIFLWVTSFDSPTIEFSLPINCTFACWIAYLVLTPTCNKWLWVSLSPSVPSLCPDPYLISSVDISVTQYICLCHNVKYHIYLHSVDDFS